MSCTFQVAAGILFLASASTLSAAPVETNSSTPILRVHAHNDYEHPHPLSDALAQGFCSVEADIFLVKGKLLIAHTVLDLSPERTLESLYLEPLKARVKQNGGRVYPNGPEFSLLIDFKTEPKTTYAALMEVLKKYQDILTVFRDGKKETNAVLAVLSGDYPRDMLASEKVRLAGGDGRLRDLEKNPTADLVPWLSEDWGSHFKWRAKGEMPEEERARLKSIVARAHEQGRRVRFWGSPDKPVFWREMLDDGVDLVNTDDLKGFREFYLNWEKRGGK